MFGTAMVGCLLVVSDTIALFIIFRSCWKYHHYSTSPQYHDHGNQMIHKISWFSNLEALGLSRLAVRSPDSRLTKQSWCLHKHTAEVTNIAKKTILPGDRWNSGSTGTPPHFLVVGRTSIPTWFRFDPSWAPISAYVGAAWAFYSVRTCVSSAALAA